MINNAISTSSKATSKPRDAYALIGRASIAAVVDDFYDRVQCHPTLAGPFAKVSDWTEHKARLTHFWWLSLGGPAYRQDRYKTAQERLPANVTPELIADWLKLFQETLNDHLPKEIAALWFARASNIGASLRLMVDYYD